MAVDKIANVSFFSRRGDGSVHAYVAGQSKVDSATDPGYAAEPQFFDDYTPSPPNVQEHLGTLVTAPSLIEIVGATVDEPTPGTARISVPSPAAWGGEASAKFSGSGSPVGTVTPANVGDLYVDNVTPALYQATGLTSADWAPVAAAGGGSQPVVTATIAFTDIIPNPNFAGRFMAQLLTAAASDRFITLLAVDVLEAFNDSTVGSAAIEPVNDPQLDVAIVFGGAWTPSDSPDLTTLGPLDFAGDPSIPSFLTTGVPPAAVRLPAGQAVWLDFFGLAGDGTTGSLQFQLRIEPIA